ncbi:unnamed protein product, partial [Laminaria digitata]
SSDSGVNVSYEYAYLLSSCKHRRQPQRRYSSCHQKVTNKRYPANFTEECLLLYQHNTLLLLYQDTALKSRHIISPQSLHIIYDSPGTNNTFHHMYVSFRDS